MIRCGLFHLPAHLGTFVVGSSPEGRVSSFGASGTIAHALLVFERATSSGSFRMPGEVLPRCGDATAAARLSSFGFSGTIAHGAFALDCAKAVNKGSFFTSLFRHKSTSRSTVEPVV